MVRFIVVVTTKTDEILLERWSSRFATIKEFIKKKKDQSAEGDIGGRADKNEDISCPDPYDGANADKILELLSKDRHKVPWESLKEIHKYYMKQNGYQIEFERFNIITSIAKFLFEDWSYKYNLFSIFLSFLAWYFTEPLFHSLFLLEVLFHSDLLIYVLRS